MDAFEQLKEDGRKEGLKEGLKRSLARVFAQRKLMVTRKEAALIDACNNTRRLARWLDRAVTADTVAEAFRTGAVPRTRTRRAHRGPGLIDYRAFTRGVMARAMTCGG
jgi:hypothetical protein